MPVITSTRKRKKVSPPMHQVNESRSPLLRTATGWRCRKTLLSTAIARVRRSRGMPCRKIDPQTCDSRTESVNRPKTLMVRPDYRLRIADFGLRIKNHDLLNPQSEIRNPQFPVIPSQSCPDWPTRPFQTGI